MKIEFVYIHDKKELRRKCPEIMRDVDEGRLALDFAKAEDGNWQAIFTATDPNTRSGWTETVPPFHCA